MNKLIILASFILFFSCQKESDELIIRNANADSGSGKSDIVNSDVNNQAITVEVISDDEATVEITSLPLMSFNGKLSKNFTPPTKTVFIKVKSTKPVMISISVYIDNKMQVFRRASCEVLEYELTYNI